MAEIYRVDLAAPACSDLARVFEYIARHSAENAAGFVEKILGQIDQLESMPASYKRIGRTRSKQLPVYSIVIHPYVVYYSVDANARQVLVLTIRHGARRKPRRFE